MRVRIPQGGKTAEPMIASRQCTLVLFGGLPGTGKTTVSRVLARRLGAVWLRVDTIEQAMRGAGIGDIGPAGYAVATSLAEANLELGLTVVVDCVNPVAESRREWRETAARTTAQLTEIELVCSDWEEHRRRVDSRCADIPGHRLPSWQDVIEIEFEPWHGDHLVLDTAGTPITETVGRAEAYVLNAALSSRARMAGARKGSL